jgi:hypothetical protein
MGMIILGIDPDRAVHHFLDALNVCERVEPLLALAFLFRDQGKWLLAFYFCNIALQLPYPDHLLLEVDRKAYIYTRYHLMGIIGFYVQRFDVGKRACEEAIRVAHHSNDIETLKFYIKEIKE